MSEEKQKHQYPYEPIDLPSGGSLYSENSPLRSGKIDLKYMTAKEEDILTSQNLIKKGVVLDHLLDSLILTEGVKQGDLLLGDKNAILVAARILGYGKEYPVTLTNPDNGEDFLHTFDLSTIPYKKSSIDPKQSKNEFEFELPVSKVKVKFKLLTGNDDKLIQKELDSLSKLGSSTREVTTRLRYSIVSIDGEADKGKLSSFVDNMLSRDSLALRNHMTSVSPDIDMIQTVDFTGVEREVVIPMDTTFFWPTS